jgi:hypothetical protein
MSDLKLTRNEQDALADLCQFAAAVNWRTMVEEKELTQGYINQLENIICRYEHLNWGRLYDVLHRTGANQ